jgi:hypothetical protein
MPASFAWRRTISGAALPSLAALPPVALAVLVPESLQSHDRSALPPPAAPQRGPPTA